MKKKFKVFASKNDGAVVSKTVLSAKKSAKSKRPIKAAESYGWVVDDWEAQEAYDFAIESGWWDEASLNADIVKAISQEELAACLAFIFRNNDFQEWNERNDSDDDDEYEEEE